MKNDDFSRFVDKFIDDSHGLLNELEGKLLELEQDTSNQQLIESVFRAMHTLKGIGSMFGFNNISEYTHHLESIYDKIREGLLLIDISIFEITFASIDHLRNLLSDQEMKNPQLVARNAELTHQLEQLTLSKHSIPNSNSTSPKPDKNVSDGTQPTTWYIQLICSEELINRAINIAYIFQDLAKIGTYSVFQHPPGIHNNLGKDEEIWGVLLTSTADYPAIEEVFMFIIDNVRIVKFANPEESLSDSKLDPTANVAHDTNSILNLAKQVAEESLRQKDDTSSSTTINAGSVQPRVLIKTPRISVGADKLDKLMFLVGELFTTRSELAIATANFDMVRIKLASEKIDRLASQLRNNALSIRLVPLRELTMKFKRLIRDLSLQLDKNIDFEIQGDDTELDKNLVDNLADPFMHIIRNCIDHGIESREVRKENNKSENGVIRFVASQAGNYINIKISDDGKGIDKEYIRTKAIEKGFIQPNAQMSDQELLELIFLPGFSTAESLTQVSGRGVGMDVVKRSITKLRGTVNIATEKGKGTTFNIKLQQTIAIMDTLLIQVGKSYFTVILEEVEICELEDHETLFSRFNSHVKVADDLIPFVSLRKAFSIQGESPITERIIVIKHQHQRFAILTDNIIGQFQAVLKPLSPALQHREYLSGASIMGDGNIAFMLDTQKLCTVLN